MPIINPTVVQTPRVAQPDYNDFMTQFAAGDKQQRDFSLETAKQLEAEWAQMAPQLANIVQTGDISTKNRALEFALQNRRAFHIATSNAFGQSMTDADVQSKALFDIDQIADPRYWSPAQKLAAATQRLLSDSQGQPTVTSPASPSSSSPAAPAADFLRTGRFTPAPQGAGTTPQAQRPSNGFNPTQPIRGVSPGYGPWVNQMGQTVRPQGGQAVVGPQAGRPMGTPGFGGGQVDAYPGAWGDVTLPVEGGYPQAPWTGQYPVQAQSSAQAPYSEDRPRTSAYHGEIPPSGGYVAQDPVQDPVLPAAPYVVPAYVPGQSVANVQGQNTQVPEQPTAGAGGQGYVPGNAYVPQQIGTSPVQGSQAQTGTTSGVVQQNQQTGPGSSSTDLGQGQKQKDDPAYVQWYAEKQSWIDRNIAPMAFARSPQEIASYVESIMDPASIVEMITGGFSGTGNMIGAWDILMQKYGPGSDKPNGGMAPENWQPLTDAQIMARGLPATAQAGQADFRQSQGDTPAPQVSYGSASVDPMAYLPGQQVPDRWEPSAQVGRPAVPDTFSQKPMAQGAPMSAMDDFTLVETVGRTGDKVLREEMIRRGIPELALAKGLTPDEVQILKRYGTHDALNAHMGALQGMMEDSPLRGEALARYQKMRVLTDKLGRANGVAPQKPEYFENDPVAGWRLSSKAKDELGIYEIDRQIAEMSKSSDKSGLAAMWGKKAKIIEDAVKAQWSTPEGTYEPIDPKTENARRESIAQAAAIRSMPARFAQNLTEAARGAGRTGEMVLKAVDDGVRYAVKAGEATVEKVRDWNERQAQSAWQRAGRLGGKIPSFAEFSKEEAQRVLDFVRGADDTMLAGLGLADLSKMRNDTRVSESQMMKALTDRSLAELSIAQEKDLQTPGSIRNEAQKAGTDLNKAQAGYYWQKPNLEREQNARIKEGNLLSAQDAFDKRQEAKFTKASTQMDSIRKNIESGIRPSDAFKASVGANKDDTGVLTVEKMLSKAKGKNMFSLNGGIFSAKINPVEANDLLRRYNEWSFFNDPESSDFWELSKDGKTVKKMTDPTSFKNQMLGSPRGRVARDYMEGSGADFAIPQATGGGTNAIFDQVRGY